MKLRGVTVNNRKAQLELLTRSGRTLPFPFVKLRPKPSAKNRIVTAVVDRELASEGVTFVLESGGRPRSR